jgi:hypothetical protein
MRSERSLLMKNSGAKGRGDYRNRSFPFVTPAIGAPEAEYTAPTLHITSREVSLSTMSRFPGKVLIHLTDEEAEQVKQIAEGGTARMQVALLALLASAA